MRLLFGAALLIIAAYSYFLTPVPVHPPVWLISQTVAFAQPDEISCGPTSGQMLLALYGKHVPFGTVKAKAKTEWFTYNDSHIGMTAPDQLSRAISDLGVPTTLRVGNLPLLKMFVSQNRPVIVLLRSGATTWHYVVVTGYNEQQVTVADPGGGIIWSMSTNDFLTSWAFKSDMVGDEIVSPCPACNGSGLWLTWNLGPLGYCELCGGKGTQPDFVGALLRVADVYPMTMIVPSKPFSVDSRIYP